VFAVTILSAYLAVQLFRIGHGRSTFIFLAATPNWIFIPLPICEALYGRDGVHNVLIFNVAMVLVLWTWGVSTLCGGLKGAHALRGMVLNPGVLATAAGIGLALAFPGAASWAEASQDLRPLAVGRYGIVQALGLLGGMTVPLSLVVIGAQIGGLKAWRGLNDRALLGVQAARLILAPALVVVALRLLTGAGVALPAATGMVSCVIAAMPVAVSCSLFVERFGGDADLAASSIVVSTLLSVATIPFVLFAIERLAW
jgi:hypothetical protein